MAENPFQSMLNPNTRQAGLWDLRMMSAANRMETPFERGMRGGLHGGVSGNPMLASLAGMANEPDYSQFTYDPAMNARAVAAGVQPLEASQVRQNAILPNTGFFGRHPNLSRALEGGMFAAAATPGGGQTIGENISAAMEGMIGGERMRQGLYRQQFARPFEAAGALEQLTDMRQRRELQSADIEHLRALNEHVKNGDDYKVQQLTESNRHNEAMEALGLQKSEFSRANAPEHNLDLGTREQLAIQGIDPNKATPAQLQMANKAAQAQAVARSGASAGAGAVARNAVNAPLKATATRATWIKQQIAHPGPTWMAAGVSPGDKDAAKKLGDYYDSVFPPQAPEASQGIPSHGSSENPILVP